MSSSDNDFKSSIQFRICVGIWLSFFRLDFLSCESGDQNLVTRRGSLATSHNKTPNPPDLTQAVPPDVGHLKGYRRPLERRSDFRSDIVDIISTVSIQTSKSENIRKYQKKSQTISCVFSLFTAFQPESFNLKISQWAPLILSRTFFLYFLCILSVFHLKPSHRMLRELAAESWITIHRTTLLLSGCT